MIVYQYQSMQVSKKKSEHAYAMYHKAYKRICSYKTSFQGIIIIINVSVLGKPFFQLAECCDHGTR